MLERPVGPSWSRHEVDDGKLTVWVSGGKRACAIAVDATGIHPRLHRLDFRDRTTLANRSACDAYAHLHDLDAQTTSVLYAALDERSRRLGDEARWE